MAIQYKLIPYLREKNRQLQWEFHTIYVYIYISKKLHDLPLGCTHISLLIQRKATDSLRLEA